MKISKDINGTIGGCNNKKEGKFVWLAFERVCMDLSSCGFTSSWVTCPLSCGIALGTVVALRTADFAVRGARRGTVYSGPGGTGSVVRTFLVTLRRIYLWFFVVSAYGIAFAFATFVLLSWSPYLKTISVVFLTMSCSSIFFLVVFCTPIQFFCRLKSETIVSAYCFMSLLRGCDCISACASETAIPCRTSMCIVAYMMLMVVSIVATAIYVVYSWGVIVEMVHSVESVDGEKPCVGSPDGRAEKIISCWKQSVLPIVKDVAQVCIAVGPIQTI